MKKYVGEKSGQRAIERWENEGGEVLAIALLETKKKEVEKRRRGETRFKQKLLRSKIG